jgi:carboxypeptidase Taq
MEDKLNQLKNILAEYLDLTRVASLLTWDLQTFMPVGGAKERGEQLGTVRRLAHLRLTSTETGKLLEELKPLVTQLDPDSDDARLVKVVGREYERRIRVPVELVSNLAETTMVAHHAWEEARAENDFSKFQPHLEKIVDLRRHYAACFAPYEHIYDPLLDIYEPGMKTTEVKSIFAILRPQQVALVKAITQCPQVDDAALHQSFDAQKQWDFGVEVITKFGYDWKCGRQDKAAHPFTNALGLGDVRITTRIIPKYVGSALFSTMHESGHATYDQGIDPAFGRTILGETFSHALHESQSRMWENLVGRSKPFWHHFYPRLQEYFSAQLGNVSLDTFYKGINKVETSLIRVEADEATYNLHVMLRLDLEIDLVEGKLEVKDLPEAWNARMKEYLGVVPPDNSRGVLQDVHWAHGDIGYFATYALGNLVSAQLWERINKDIPNLQDQIRGGKFEALLGWVREKIHRHGSKFEVQELVQRVTGSKIDPAPYMRYLTKKYSEIYGI